MSKLSSGGRMPKVVVFDLEHIMGFMHWSHPASKRIDTHISPPLKRKGETVNQLVDRHGQTLGFYPEVPEILQILKDSSIHVAAASRTQTPDLARDALKMLIMPGGGTAISYFNTMEIYPGSKLKHFKEIHKKTGIPYSEMLFFDDESRNRETESLGVTMFLIESGVNKAVFQKGLKRWRERNGHN